MTIATLFHLFLAIGLAILGGIHLPLNGALGQRIRSARFATLAF